jgi:hypothetical protein
MGLENGRYDLGFNLSRCPAPSIGDAGERPNLSRYATKSGGFRH